MDVEWQKKNLVWHFPTSESSMEPSTAMAEGQEGGEEEDGRACRQAPKGPLARLALRRQGGGGGLEVLVSIVHTQQQTPAQC